MQQVNANTDSYPSGMELPYTYKAKEWPTKTPKMFVMEYFQRYHCKGTLKWERIPAHPKKHLVKCILPEEFGLLEFVPNKLFNSVKEAEHNVAVLVLAYLNAIPPGCGDPNVIVAKSSYVPPPLPPSSAAKKERFRMGLGTKRKFLDAMPQVGVYSAVPPPNEKLQKTGEPDRYTTAPSKPKPKVSQQAQAPNQKFAPPQNYFVPASSGNNTSITDFQQPQQQQYYTPTSAQQSQAYYNFYGNSYGYQYPAVSGTEYTYPSYYGSQYTTQSQPSQPPTVSRGVPQYQQNNPITYAPPSYGGYSQRGNILKPPYPQHQ
jgi:hypothetical protein